MKILLHFLLKLLNRLILTLLTQNLILFLYLVHKIVLLKLFHLKLKNKTLDFVSYVLHSEIKKKEALEKIVAKTNANTMLNRSIGTTCLTVPNFKARK